MRNFFYEDAGRFPGQMRDLPLQLPDPGLLSVLMDHAVQSVPRHLKPPGSDPVQIGIRPLGAVPSGTNLLTGEGANSDNVGGAYISLLPDHSYAGNERGDITIAAFGQGSGGYVNSIRFANRWAPNSIAIRMLIDSVGNVGIGTVSPQAKLDVEGNVRVGKGSAPAGITLFDTATGQPFCLRITSGTLVPSAGQCPN